MFIQLEISTRLFIALRDVSLVGSPSEVDAAVSLIDGLAANYANSATPLDAMPAPGASGTDDEREILASIKATEAITLPLIANVVRLRRAGNEAEAQAVLMRDARPQFVMWLRQINQFIDLEEAKNKTIARWAVRSIKPLHYLAGVMRTLADGNFAVDVPAAHGKDEIAEISRTVQVFKNNGLASIRIEAEAREAQTAMRATLKASEATFLAEQQRVVDTMAAALARLADGDLTVRVDTGDNASYIALMNDFNNAVENLATQLAQVDAAAEQVAAAGAEITSGSQSLTNSASQQAASLEDVGSKVMHFASMAEHSASNAREAQSLAARAQRHTEEGAARMGRLTQAMTDLQQASV